MITRILNYYRFLSFGEKLFLWFMVFAVSYMMWQFTIRPFWNNPA